MKYTDSDNFDKFETIDQSFLKSYADNKAGKFSVFKTTKPVSTYHLCVVLGDYFSITATAA